MAVLLGMTAPDPEHLLRHALRRDALATAQCLDEETVAALAEGTLDGPARARALAHLAECPRCRAAVASVSHALGDPRVAREIATPAGARRRLFRIAVPVAAAAVILLLVMPAPKSDVAPPHRAPTITAVSSPVLVSPVGIVAGADLLRWSSVSGADRYRTTLFDDAGEIGRAHV